MFGVGYMFYYHVLGAGDLMIAEFDKEWQRGEKIKAAAMAKFEAQMETMQPSKDPAVLNSGKDIFERMCAPCHRPDAGGLVGPNLTDDYWIHGPLYKDNIRTIVNGVPAKGMITWKGILKPGEIQAVASYIYTLRGTKPPNPKPPENQAPVKTGPSEFE
jgi:cytochrome c oxidase cbb3-type subunit 3